LFPNREGNREANEVANRWLKRACEAAGVPVLTMHGLRHTAGSQASAAGIAPNIIKERLGHSHVSTTLQMYVHPDCRGCRRT
jgi:integrase